MGVNGCQADSDADGWVVRAAVRRRDQKKMELKQADSSFAMHHLAGMVGGLDLRRD